MLFMCFLNWTDKGAQASKEVTHRYERTKTLAETLGGNVISAYVTTGQYDVAMTLDLPDGEAMGKFATCVNSGGYARTTTVRAFPPEEYAKIVAEAPQW